MILSEKGTEQNIDRRGTFVSCSICQQMKWKNLSPPAGMDRERESALNGNQLTLACFFRLVVGSVWFAEGFNARPACLAHKG